MNIYIIGSGIVGLTIGIKFKEKLTSSKVTIIEKEELSTKHGSGRNSGIIHSGVYYPSETLKAKLCIDGAKQLKNYVKNKKLWIDECGKILVPTNDISYKNLDLLINRAKENKVEANLISNAEGKESSIKLISFFVKPLEINALWLIA